MKINRIVIAAALLFLAGLVGSTSIIGPRDVQAQFDTPNRAFHNATAFRLEGRHQTVACESCHLNGQFAGTPTTCYQCHWIRRKDDRYETRLGTQCETCHRPTSWTAVNFNHTSVAGLALGTSHRTLSCASCHQNGQFRTGASDCVSCHQRDYQATQSPNHAAAGFPTTCDSCHRPNDTTWQSGGTSGGGFSHAAVFPLVGQHATQTCATCHKNNVYKGTPRDCVGCHQADYNSTRNPNHAAAGFPTTCDACHKATDPSFAGSGASRSFDHNATFPLVGQHATQTCTACHTNGVYKGTPRDCVGCHRANYNSTQNPNHAAAGFPTTCETCHRPTDASWRGGGSFNHNSVFALVGTHATQACATCHVNNVFTGTRRDCVGCHQAQYNATSRPNHASAGFSTSCESCHKATDAQWTGVSFNHNSFFTLVGTHATQTCATCHKNNVYKGTPRDCVGCHLANYNATQNPNHASSGFPTTCENCHRASDTSWRGGGAFNHNAVFALVGTHATQQCAACHKNNVFTGTRRDCVGCHQTEYNATSRPNHASAGFSTSCESCHKATDAQWTGVTFNHNAFFSLVGTHATQTCATCHKNNVYKGTPRDCIGCHQAQYNATTTPNHAAAGFSTACDSCHKATDAQWKGVTFNHNSFFALVGTHATQTCATCHKNNVYKGTPRDCVGCHQAQYNATTTPNHAAAGFSTACDSCHKATDAQWKGITFNHNAFFSLVGTHATQTCATCHKNNVYKGTPRDCVGCHLSKYNSTTNPNHAAAGFPTTCDSCHKAADSSWNQGKFTHTRFPLTGRHNVACAQCHTTPNNYQVFSCTVCHSRSSTDSQHRGRSGYVYDSNACYSCHPNGRS